ncbi:MAG: hypothetical protein ACJAY8_000128 [Sphingobacteriales bacterium]|jgi:hypothetical protein
MARFLSLPLFNFGLALVFSLFSFNAVSQTSLSAGDAAFVAINSDGDDDISFILLKDVDVGTVIKITDQGWNDVGSAFFIANDDSTGLVWVATSSFTRGTLVHIQTTASGTPITPVASVGSVSGAIELTDNSGLNPDDGDQLFMYQGPELAPVFISGVHWNSDVLTAGLNWDLAAINSASSNLPDQLTNGVNAVWLYGPLLAEKRNFRFDCSLVSATVTDVRLALSDINNWEVAVGSTPYTQNPFPCSFTILCDEPDVPTVVANNAGLCGAETTSLSITGDLGEATSWEVYTGSCGGASIGSTATDSFAIAPLADEIYYIRGEGGCATPGSCGTASVTVSPEFSATENVIVCFGSSYTAPDGTILLNILSQTIHTSNLISAAGCDSVIVSTIDVNTVYMSNESQMICSGDDFTFPDGTTVSNITAQVVHNSNLLTDFGCDSIIVTTIDVNPVYLQNESATICAGDSFTFPDGTVINNITSQVVQTSNLLTAATTCDSIIITTVDVNPVYLQNESATICAGDSFTFPDGTVINDITSQVVHTSNLLTAATTCDSIIITTVDVNPVYLQNESISICSGSDYTFPDGTVVTDVTFQVTHTSNLVAAITGCDSIIISTIDVNAVYLQTESASICFGEDFTFPDGTVVTAILAQTVHTSNLLTAATNCDSIIVTTVNVLPTYSFAQSASVCSGEDYTFPDGTVVTDIAAQVVQTSNLVTAIAGCDSIIVTTVDVNPVFLHNESISICSGADYTFPDGTVVTDVTAQVIHTSNLATAITGCDSIIISTIDINAVYLQTESASICFGEGYTFPDGTFVTEVLTQMVHTSSLLTAATGCDSIIVTTVNVLPTYSFAQSASVCSGANYTFPDGTVVTNIAAQVVQTSNLVTAIAGCDSIIVTTVDVNPVFLHNESISICSGSDYTFPDGTVVTDVTAQVVQTSNLVTAAAGCDSVIITTVDVNPVFLQNEGSTICSGEDFTFPDGTVVTDITAQVTQTSNLLTAIAGCDSIIITIVDVLPTYIEAESSAICSGESYTFPDGTVVDDITAQLVRVSNLLTSGGGCDSIIVSTIDILPVYILAQYANRCSGESFTFPDGTVVDDITEQVVHTSNLVTGSGCDSIVIYTVDVNPIYATTETAAICPGGDFTFPDGSVLSNISDPVSYTSNLLTSSGACDSIIVTNIEINPVYLALDTVDICQGWGHTFRDGKVIGNIESSFSYASNLISKQFNCDSIFITYVNVTPNYDLEENYVICSGGSFTFPDGYVQDNITGPTIHTSNLVTRVLGCDSTINTRIDVNPSYFSQEERTICYGEDVTLPDGSVVENVLETESFLSNFQTLEFGCDSTVELLVNVLPIYFEEKAMEVCSGGTVELPDGTVVHNVETTVVPMEVEEQEESVLVCKGEDVELPDGTIVVNVQENETFVTVLSSQLTGCDSIIITNVDVDSPDFVQQSVTICKGGDYTFPDGTVISEINNKIAYTSQVIQDGRACYSTIETVIEVFEIDTEIVRDEFEFRAVSPVGTFQWLDCDNNFAPIVGETEPFIRADDSRNVAVEITVGECRDTSVCSGTLPSAVSESFYLEGIDVYPNPSDGEVFIDLNGISEVTYSLMDIQGKVIEAGNIQSNNKFTIGSMAKAGVYILSLESGGERKLVKLIRR